MPFIKMSKKEYLEMLWGLRDDILSLIGALQKTDPDTTVFQDMLMKVNAKIKEAEDEVSKR
jgi:hypothetical protein